MGILVKEKNNEIMGSCLLDFIDKRSEDLLNKLIDLQAEINTNHNGNLKQYKSSGQFKEEVFPPIINSLNNLINGFFNFFGGVIMSTINERVRALRKHLKLTQKQFGKRIGVKSQDQVAGIERGSCGVNETKILLICKEFGVSEKWLRNGEGEMFDVASDSLKNSALEQLSKEYNLSAPERSYIQSFVTKSRDDRELFLLALEGISRVQLV